MWKTVENLRIPELYFKKRAIFRRHVDVHKWKGVRLMWTGRESKPDFPVDVING